MAINSKRGRTVTSSGGKSEEFRRRNRASRSLLRSESARMNSDGLASASARQRCRGEHGKRFTCGSKIRNCENQRLVPL